ncbi:MAG TPA: GntR family transcriptional regulator [Burkholderiales bacterium]|nr:GntR family transcriptional regulator [Burkholderiales bacterium]
MATETIARSALYQEVAERLRSRIFAHELAPGAWIDEQALAESYGISRTPMREALKVLAAEGLVTLRPRRGCYVTELTERDLDEIFPVLALLEGRCAFEAAQKAGPKDLKRLEALHESVERAGASGDIEGYFQANQDFHLALQELTGNRWLIQAIEDMRKVLKLIRRHSLLRKGRVAESLEEHRAIMQGIRAGDPAAAEQAMRHHLMRGRAALAAVDAPRPRARAPAR